MTPYRDYTRAVCACLRHATAKEKQAVARELQERILARRLRGFSSEELARMTEFYDRMNRNLEGYRRELEEALPREDREAPAGEAERKEGALC